MLAAPEVPAVVGVVLLVLLVALELPPEPMEAFVRMNCDSLALLDGAPVVPLVPVAPLDALLLPRWIQPVTVI